MDSLPFLCQPKSEGIQPCPGSALAFPRQGMWSSPSNFPAWPCKASTCLSFHSTAGHGNICNSSPNQSGFGQELLFQAWHCQHRFDGFYQISSIWSHHAWPWGICLQPGQAMKIPQHDLANFSTVCHPIILASKAQMGILS